MDSSWFEFEAQETQSRTQKSRAKIWWNFVVWPPYLGKQTRPVTLCTVNNLSRHMNEPTNQPLLCLDLFLFYLWALIRLKDTKEIYAGELIFCGKNWCWLVWRCNWFIVNNGLSTNVWLLTRTKLTLHENFEIEERYNATRGSQWGTESLINSEPEDLSSICNSAIMEE